jgi:predicted nucleic acid-binding protein
VPEVICNTSPLQYLHQLNILDILPGLYGKVLIPQAVEAELQIGRLLGLALPDLPRLEWAVIHPVDELPFLNAIPDLGRGEREVLALGAQRTGTVLVLDDGLGRQYARLLKLPFTGTLGVLVKAKQVGLVPAIRPLLDGLDRLGFWVTSEVRAKALALAGEQ